MRIGDHIVLHGGGDESDATVLAIVGNGPMPTCFKVLKVKGKDGKIHDNVVYHEDKGSKTTYWSLPGDKVEKSPKKSRQGSK